MLLLYFFLKKKYRIRVFVGSELFRTEGLKNKPKHSFCAEFHELSEFPIEIKKSDVENPQKSFKEDQREPSIGIGFMLLWCLHSTARSVCCFYFFLECRNGTDNDCFRTGRDGWTRLIADNWQIFVRLTRQPY